MKIGIVGAGFVCDYYLSTLPMHPELQVVGITDQLPERSDKVGRHYGVPRFPSVESLLRNADVELVLNLTNPRDH
jgi:predicted dehydrogenase